MKGKDVETGEDIIIAWWTSTQTGISNLRSVAYAKDLSEATSYV
jgi:hypothetical protein